MGTSVRDLLRVDPAEVDGVLADAAAGATPGVAGRERAERELRRITPELAELAERLYAGARTDGRRVLLVLQGTDASGKDGAVKRVVGRLSPALVRYTAFGRPSEEELAHDFLWRITRALPPAGCLGVFNRSQYEDVLVVRVHDLVPPAEWEQRYALINAWEAEQAAAGLTIVKVFLHVSPEEQRTRLLARVEDPTKRWKANPGDLAERALWPAYREAYAAALTRCSTAVAPWYAVPADHKWYRNWALAHLLLETLRAMDLRWPERPELDLPGMRAMLAG